LATDGGVVAKQIVVVGQSLKNGPATMLVTKQPIGALVLVSPFTNLPDALAERLPRLPPRLVPWTHNRFDVAAYLVRFRGASLLIVSEGDGLVPLANERRLQAEDPASRWLGAPPLRHDGMLRAVAEDGRLAKVILLRPETPASRSTNPEAAHPLPTRPGHSETASQSRSRRWLADTRA
jgi:hypothetical protein